MKQTITGKWALVTGASSGLGADFARQLAGCGCNVVLTARREERLREHKTDLEKDYGVKAEVIPMDLANEEAPQRLYNEIRVRGLHMDILINNAGFGIYGPFVEIDWEREKKMLELDMITLTHLTKLFLHDMLERDYGFILQVSSIGAFQPSPTYATYSAAKSYVLNFSQALDYELRNTNVSCTVLSPGITSTEFLEVAGQKPTLYQRLMMMESEEVTRMGIKAMLKRKSAVVPGLMNKLTIWSMKLLPDRAKAALANLTMTVGKQK